MGPPHAYPVVIISHPSRVANQTEVCVLLCATRPAFRQPEPHEVMLNSDGLYWPTLCRCDLFFLVKKAELKDQRGTVSPAERKRIIAAIIRANGWV
jgi:hypothetical protein